MTQRLSDAARAVLFAVLVGGCLQSHGDPAVKEIGDRNCITCHQAEFDATSLKVSIYKAHKPPDHKALGFDPAKCVDCHVTTANPKAWRLAINHTETVFATKSGPHAGIACTGCHNLALTDPANPSEAVGNSIKGANTDCIGCHTPTDPVFVRGAHSGTDPSFNFPTTSSAQYAGKAFAYSTTDHRFCLECHASGVAGKHNDTIFSRNHGNANGVCATCHQPALGSNAKGQNAPCVNSGCHDPNSDKPIRIGHQGVRNLGPTDCLSCHPHGSNN